MTNIHLAGMIFNSPNPEELSDFYRGVFGVPFEKRQHGKIREHLECEFGGIHFAILKKAEPSSGGSIVPSFAVADLQAFLDNIQKMNIKPLHPILDIGEGKRICSISDPDGNMVRLIQVDQI